MMLKIKDNVDLKELEKFGFKITSTCPGLLLFYPNGNNGNCRYFSSIELNKETKKINFNLENMSCWCNDLEQLDLDFENIQYSYNEMKKVILTLIEADLVEAID